MRAPMKAEVTLGQSGIMVHHKDSVIALDPSRHADSHFTFVSHAHVDHLHKRNMAKKSNNKNQVLASKETALIAEARGYKIGNAAEHHDGFRLVDTGHILGSRGLLIDEEVYYTGDISMRERAFMKPAKVPHAKTLIIESTFGRPEYIFPPISEITHKTNKIIAEMYDLGIPVILMGYTLGKAQLLTKLFGHWDPIIYDSVAKINSIYSDLGVKLKSITTYSQAEEQGLLIKNRPWVMIAPLMSSRCSFLKEMKNRCGAVTVGFTGWAVGSRYRYMMGLDYVMPVSDHCDYNELVAAVKQCGPEKVYTFHGFAKEFASSLSRLGFDAEEVGHGKNPKERTTISLDSFL
ncbi:MAG: exonuclease [Thermoproteota archaeon]|nr:exonuclease [Thermoproteota archaeon]